MKWLGIRLPHEVPPGEHRFLRGTLALRYTRHLPPNVEQGFQALAVDENRATFHPRVWIVPLTKEPMLEERPVEQRWFIGAHANVGGGYRDDRLDLFHCVGCRKKLAQLELNFRNSSRFLWGAI